MFKFLNTLFESFHGKGFRAYKSIDAQRKFADSLLSMSNKMFWFPVAYLGFLLYDGNNIAISSIIFILIFFYLGSHFRHEGLKVYDYIDTESRKENRLRRK